jgi:hypothetical protein
MKSAETIGLIKFDFLGLKTLDQIRDAVAMIAVNHGVTLDMALIPDDDDHTWKLLQDGDALGVFQLESSGMRELLGRLKPNCLDDLIALVALYRPGPLSSGMVDDFVDRKHGRQEVSYPHPSLRPILENTYGTIVYQEQVMQVAQVLSGYSLGEADLLRRAMGKKDAEKMESFIYNMAPINEEGEHWVAVINNPKQNTVEHYDSLGFDPSDTARENIKKLIGECPQFKINNTRWQSLKSDDCGYFCMKFIRDRLAGKSFKECSGWSIVEKSMEGQKDIEKFKKLIKQFGPL